MGLMLEIEKEVSSIANELLKKQSSDGSWRFCFENSPVTDAYMILLIRALEKDEDELIVQLADRIQSKQQTNGAWKLYEDEAEGNLSATIEAYTALLYSGLYRVTDPNMKMAERYILEQGGLQKAHISTKFMLAIHRLYPWPRFFPIPTWIMLLPKWFPIHFGSFGRYVRVHFAPILIIAECRFSLTTASTPDLTHLLHTQSYKRRLLHRVKSRIGLKGWREKAIRKAERYILQSIESDGTLYSYSMATIYFIYALLALGYDRKSPFIHRALAGLKSHLFSYDGYTHLQNSPSTIWDTALISYALHETNRFQHANPEATVKYLMRYQQQTVLKDASHFARVLPVGWGFSEGNSFNPDVDDTQAVLRALSPFAKSSDDGFTAWKDGLNWLLSMQNSDGGWSGFERNKNNKLLHYLPIQSIKDTANDPSTADITGRVVEFLGNVLKLSKNHPIVERATRWLIQNQQKDGSWYGRWGVCYIYGTWAALTGLRAVGVEYDHPTIVKAKNWLLSIQRDDGGWGESCKSDVVRRYIPLSFSTRSQTAWAVDALIAVSSSSSPEIERGVRHLIGETSHPSAWTYPTGAGLPGQFYIYYHSYNYIWPLLALGHYRNKYGDD